MAAMVRRNALACCDAFEQLLETGKSSDFEIVVGQQIIAVHRCILIARSPVFEAMLRHDTKESREGRVVLSDTKPELARELLRFLYAGRVHELPKIWRDLLVAAEKYKVQGLKETCEQCGCDALNDDNALACLQFAHLHGASELKKRAAEIVVARAHEVCRMPEFRGLESDLKDELFRMLADELASSVPVDGEWHSIPGGHSVRHIEVELCEYEVK